MVIHKLLRDVIKEENREQLSSIEDPFYSSGTDCDPSERGDVTQVLIGSATSSSILLAALLFWAFLLTAESHSEPDTGCLTFPPMIRLLCDWSNLECTQLFHSRIPVAPPTLKDHCPLMPPGERGQSIRGPFQNPQFDWRPNQVIWKESTVYCTHIHRLPHEELCTPPTSLHSSVHKDGTHPTLFVISVNIKSSESKEDHTGRGKKQHRGGKRWQDHAANLVDLVDLLSRADVW